MAASLCGFSLLINHVTLSTRMDVNEVNFDYVDGCRDEQILHHIREQEVDEDFAEWCLGNQEWQFNENMFYIHT